ncbi:MAG: HipA domain-containing protein [Oscillospiraceae bacterium]|nr:HipA domain-containing protein [Oscillospiraceae bacterium]
MSNLVVELYGSVLGTIAHEKNRISFTVDQNVFEKYPLSSTIMSLSVPLNLKYTSAQKKRVDIFFAELLPEGRNYEWLLQSLPRDERTFYAMLRKYGRDIAGALSIYDPDDPTSTSKAYTEPVDGKEVRYLLEHMPQAALANSPISGKTSLGGAQGKILLARIGALWHRVHNGYPSTHILKPVAPEYPTMIYDEAFCMQMAYDCGLTGHPVWIENFDGADALVIERYDRNDGMSGARIHQEDFNQALGARGHEKYQEYGGKVSAKRIAQTLARFGKREDVTRFASQLIFAVAIGNLDMHAKNISILHFPDESIALAPTYDQVPLRHQGTDGRMALSINGKYMHASISLADIVAELISWQCLGFSGEDEVAFFTKNRLVEYRDALDGAVLDKRAYPNLKTDISTIISRLLSGNEIGIL